jgi:CheY-like chemotaxis protein
MLSTLEVVVKSLFETQGKLYFSFLEDGRHSYYQISTSEHETKLFRQHRLENRSWEPCPFAVNMPEEFRSLAGEYHSRTADGKLISLTWRIPLLLDVPEKPRKMNILGIDDQEVIRELLSSIISRMGHHIVIAADGTEGMRLFKETHFDLVIVEADLPGVNGWDIAHQVKAISPTTPVIMLSGWGLETEAEGLLKRNADFVLAKPFKMEQLGRIIGAACDMISV